MGAGTHPDPGGGAPAKKLVGSHGVLMAWCFIFPQLGGGHWGGDRTGMVLIQMASTGWHLDQENLLLLPSDYHLLPSTYLLLLLPTPYQLLQLDSSPSIDHAG